MVFVPIIMFKYIEILEHKVKSYLEDFVCFSFMHKLFLV